MKRTRPSIIALSLLVFCGCKQNVDVPKNDAAAYSALEAGNTGGVILYANKLLAENTDPHHWQYGNVIHDANSMLGLAALRENRIDDAKAYLIKAGNTPGSPQLDSFGPHFTLAKELLEHGQRKVVIEYLDLVAKFWTHTSENTMRRLNPAQREQMIKMNNNNAKELEGWKALIVAGGVPDSPSW